jgi:magnesium-transporting ATPase (P-type)
VAAILVLSLKLRSGFASGVLFKISHAKFENKNLRNLKPQEFPCNVIIKGAPEKILHVCNACINFDAQLRPLAGDLDAPPRGSLRCKSLVQTFCRQGELMTRQHPQNIFRRYSDWLSNGSDMALLCTDL